MNLLSETHVTGIAANAYLKNIRASIDIMVINFSIFPAII